MTLSTDKREGGRLLSGLEAGTLSAPDAYTIASRLDPLLVYFVLRYLREKHPSSRPESAGVAQRIVDLTSAHPDLVTKTRAAEKDSLKEWFDDGYEMRQFFGDAEGFLDMIVDKMES
jgi:hypothetical protein